MKHRKDGIGCKWLQLLLICWESGLFHVLIDFLSASEKEVFCTHLSLGSTSGMASCSPQLLFLVTSPSSSCRAGELWICLLSPFSQPDTAATTQDATKEETSLCLCVGKRGLQVFLPFQASGSVEQETKWCL